MNNISIMILVGAKENENFIFDSILFGYAS